MLCHLVLALVMHWSRWWGIGLVLFWDVIGMGRGGGDSLPLLWGYIVLLRILVMLKDLVVSISYALNKNLICSNLNYLGMVLVLISKSFRVSRIVLKCEIEPLY